MNSDIIYESILLRTIIILAMMLFAFYLSLTLGRWTRRMRKISRSVILGVYFAAVSIAIAGTEIIVVKGRGNIPYEVMPLLLIAAIAAIVYILGKIGFRIGERNKNGNEELKRKYSEIQTAYDKLTIAEEEFEALFNAGNEAMWRADPVDHKVRYSDRVLEMFGYAPSEMEEYLKSRQGRIHPEDAAMVAQNEKDLIAAIINSFTIEYRVRHKEGRYLWVRNKATRLKYSNGSIMGVIGSVADVTKEKEYEGKILDMAYRDGLTGLPNRSAFAERFEEELRESTERTGRGVLLFVDTDNFKYINDVLGHNAGDMMLREI
ncbi:MAG: sensor domain-containing diguanylate cyclase, partial [Clostridiales bacterium]|nr:sensor domain-containing diguanylate cyclase [Clostridiales bacterium]